jgi:DNA-binding NarL/FixJ family response regulator
MGLINSKSSSKKFYTKAEDEVIVALANEGKSVSAIAEATGRSEVSLRYRITKVLEPAESFDSIHYKA